MKKAISGLLCAAIMCGGTVFAKADSAMQNALAAVKTKVDIPAELNKFESRAEEGFDGEAGYSFAWHTDDYSKQIEVCCDEKGRITNYWATADSQEDVRGFRLPKYSKEQAKQAADEFVKKMLPEMYSKTDSLVCISEEAGSMYNGETSYYFVFCRERDNVPVISNTVDVSLYAAEEGLVVRYMNTDYDYSASFKECVQTDEPQKAYQTAYPIKLHYTKDYEKSEDGTPDVTKLVYYQDMLGTGYISAQTGEAVKEYEEESNLYDYAAEKSMAYDEAAGDELFTEGELEEIRNVAGLKSAEEVEKMLRSIKDLKMTSKMKLKSSSRCKVGEDYRMDLYFGDDSSRSMSASVDAKTGEILSLSNYVYGDYEKVQISDADKETAKSKAQEFFKTVAPKYVGMYEVTDVSNYSSDVGISLARMENGIEYDENTANISYNVKEKMITSYSIYYSDAVFEDVAGVIDEDSAYSKLFENNPLKKVYIKTENGVYEQCFTMTKAFSVMDAKSGSIDNLIFVQEPDFTDIENHWCKPYVEALSEIGLRIDGETFNPDEPIKKGDLIKFFGSGLKGDNSIFYDINYYDAKAATEAMKKYGLLAEDEEFNAPVERKDACVLMVKLAGFEKIAKMSEIFDTSKANGISDDKIGAVAILSGLGVVTGSESEYIARADDNLTRAEAAAMLYRYLLTN